jgi:hypothetical protein
LYNRAKRDPLQRCLEVRADVDGLRQRYRKLADEGLGGHLREDRHLSAVFGAVGNALDGKRTRTARLHASGDG